MENKIPNKALASKLNKWAIGITLVVLPLVLIMGFPSLKIRTEIDFTFLPAIYSVINVIVAIVLLYALYAIKNKQIEKHKKAMTSAMILSAVFLVLYVVYHFTSDPIRYCKTGSIRTLYFILLNSHIVLAGIGFPLILFTYIRGYTWQIDRHRKLARWIFPLWLYLSISGPIIYLMLLPCIN